MSRAKPVDNSAAVSLFPFLAVLLCTMGALLVVLVGMSRTAREKALRQSASMHESAASMDPKLVQKLDEITSYASFLTQVRSKTEKQLREDQKRMSHLEGHMRKLQDQLLALQIAAAELEALEKDHYDDSEQAQREVDRLEKLIADTRKTIESLKEVDRTKSKSYALVPYDGPNGTLRRPIYIECRDDELILQPEGVRITQDDLRPPIGAGNPLAAALRAARDHYVRLNPAEGRDRDTEPYALVAVRPSGIAMYSLAQRAIQSADFDFGYELFEEDSLVKYQAPDPQLALVEQQAINQARIRQQVLAAAAPRAYRHRALAASGRFEFDDDGTGGYGFGGYSGGDAVQGGGGEFVGQRTTEAGSIADGSGGENGVDSSYQGVDQHSGMPPGASEARDAQELGQVHGNATGTANGTTEDASLAGGGGAVGSPPDAFSTAVPTADGEAQSKVTVSTGSPPPASVQSQNEDAEIDPNSKHGRPASQQTRGKDWAFRQKNPRAVPVRRTIRVIVGSDHLAVLSDEARIRARTLGTKTIPLHGDTVESIDELVRVVHEQIEGWGIAGEGLCWKPVLALHVGPDGQRRAEDLARLLENSGLEIRPAATTATLTPQGTSRATPPR